MKSAERKTQITKPLIFGMAAVIFALAVGIIVLCCQFVDSLQDQSAKLRKFKIKQADTIERGKTFGAEADYFDHVGNSEIKIWAKHPVASKTSGNAERLQTNGNFADAVAEYEKSIVQYKEELKRVGTDPKDIQQFSFRYEKIAECYCRLHRFPQALIACNKAIEIAPTSGPLYINRAFVYGRMGMAQKAEADSKYAKELGPDKTYAGQDWMLNMSTDYLDIKKPLK